ncbi:hypothetical protein GGTG_14287 [Gaeumannomyces tritici R3-111a-1]|uniref:F-box domain-containing protein n=1 Tax=Gaeumannomyces tritici (strain R3-111a-1) TaxID=644352 RepID=J3PL43_GAET3|nr:hypothetical protein GGTG_14287 [Gaeumannomyces tritici R3-111a-1]EJT68136.1 hypothetical protein GGTG_14287 [Gaeumannomyces tritici R3-111a-1]
MTFGPEGMNHGKVSRAHGLPPAQRRGRLVRCVPSAGVATAPSEMFSPDQLPRSPTAGKAERPFQLSIDVALDILEYVDSPGTLFSAVLTSRVFWFAFESRRQHVLRCVLERYITPSLLPLAVAALEADRARGWDAVEPVLRRSLGADPDEAAAAAAHTIGDDDPPPPRSSDPLACLSPLTRETAAALTGVHRAVEKFTLELARPALALFRSICTEGDGGEKTGRRRRRRRLEPTRREVQRIQRALYRYQIYCSTAGRASVGDARRSMALDDVAAAAEAAVDAPWTKEQRHRAQTLLLGRWPTVANEQLACACDFLEAKMQHYFEAVAKHDVEWGARKIDWVDPHMAIPHRRFLLNGGLVPLYRLSRTADEGEWKRIIEEIDLPIDCDQVQFCFLETLEGKLAMLRQTWTGTWMPRP